MLNVMKKATSSSLFATVILAAEKAFASNVGGGTGTGGVTSNISVSTDLGDWIGKIFNFVIVIAGIIFVVLFLVGGIQYLTSAGNEEASGKAKKLLVDAIIGLVIVLVAYAAGKFVLDQLGANKSGLIN